MRGILNPGNLLVKWWDGGVIAFCLDKRYVQFQISLRRALSTWPGAHNRPNFSNKQLNTSLLENGH